MTNEELVVFIQQGDDGLLPELWEQIRRFVAMKAGMYFNKLENKHGCELADLVQSGYLGMVAAVKYFKPEQGYKFLTFLEFTLKNAFREAIGIRNSKRDWLNYCDSLDRPVNEDGNTTLLDLIGDLTPGEADLGDMVIEDVWNKELRAALDEAMTILSKKQHEILTMHYYFGLSIAQIAEIHECSIQNIEQQLLNALDHIYHSKYNEILAEFLPSRTFPKSPYRRTGYAFWKDTGYSSVEAFLIPLR